MGRYTNLQEIQSLDPRRDHCRILYLTTGFEFPWDSTRSLEIALYRTYCVPSISRVLDETGEFRHHAQKRYDDTALMVAELVKCGYDSPRGHAVLRRMNRIHGHFNISNQDYLYVLSTFIYEPTRWFDRFGWRKSDPNERLAFFYFWREVGRRMGIKDIPDSYQKFENYNQQYEWDNFRYSDANRAVGIATRDLFLSWYPAFLSFLLKPVIYAMLDDTMLTAFDFPKSPPTLRWTVANGLRWRGKILKFFPARQSSAFITDGHPRSYPNGYEISDLGPDNMRGWLNKSSEIFHKH